MFVYIQLWNGFFSQNHVSQAPPAPIIEDLLSSAEFVHSDMPMVWLRRALILSEEVITNTALATKGQRNNPMWSIIRKNRITASNFGAVLSTKRRQ